jgi:putative transposase
MNEDFGVESIMAKAHFLYYHTVWATRLRRPLIDNEMRGKLYQYLLDKIAEYGGTGIAAGGTDDHVHLLLSIPARFPVARFIGRLKGSSSHWANHFFRPGAGFAWQRGYVLDSLTGESLEQITAYIENQEELHQCNQCNQEWEIFILKNRAE